MPDEKRCIHCGQLCYLDSRKGGVWKHYVTNSDFCYPDLSYVEAFRYIATVGKEEVGESHAHGNLGE